MPVPALSAAFGAVADAASRIPTASLIVAGTSSAVVGVNTSVPTLAPQGPYDGQEISPYYKDIIDNIDFCTTTTAKNTSAPGKLALDAERFCLNNPEYHSCRGEAGAKDTPQKIDLFKAEVDRIVKHCTKGPTDSKCKTWIKARGGSHAGPHTTGAIIQTAASETATATTSSKTAANTGLVDCIPADSGFDWMRCGSGHGELLCPAMCPQDRTIPAGPLTPLCVTEEIASMLPKIPCGGSTSWPCPIICDEVTSTTIASSSTTHVPEVPNVSQGIEGQLHGPGVPPTVLALPPLPETTNSTSTVSHPIPSCIPRHPWFKHGPAMTWCGKADQPPCPKLCDEETSTTSVSSASTTHVPEVPNITQGVEGQLHGPTVLPTVLPLPPKPDTTSISSSTTTHGTMKLSIPVYPVPPRIHVTPGHIPGPEGIATIVPRNENAAKAVPTPAPMPISTTTTTTTTQVIPTSVNEEERGLCCFQSNKGKPLHGKDAVPETAAPIPTPTPSTFETQIRPATIEEKGLCCFQSNKGKPLHGKDEMPETTAAPLPETTATSIHMYNTSAGLGP